MTSIQFQSGSALTLWYARVLHVLRVFDGSDPCDAVLSDLVPLLPCGITFLLSASLLFLPRCGPNVLSIAGVRATLLTKSPLLR